MFIKLTCPQTKTPLFVRANSVEAIQICPPEVGHGYSVILMTNNTHIEVIEQPAEIVEALELLTLRMAAASHTPALNYQPN